MFKIFAAARTIAGPPISIFSIIEISVEFSSATSDANGYKFTTTRSIFFALSFSNSCLSESPLARIPA